MRAVQDYLAACLALAGPMPPLDVVLHDAVGCILAADVLAMDDLPATDVAAHDGYAGAAAEIRPGARLRVIDDVLSGTSSPGRVVPGTCVRIASGGVLPDGADAVVPVEQTDRGLATVLIRRDAAPRPGDGVRRRAEDVRAGAVVLAAGTRIGPRQIALLAAVGLGRAPVHPRPRVVILPVGSDLAEAGRGARAGHVFDANGHALASAVQDADGAVFRVAAVPDEHARLRETIEDQVVRADLVIITGGLSEGREDTVKDVLTHLGSVRFDDVGISPGRRLGVGTVGDGVPILALPGHPVAAQVAFEVFVRPMLRSMAGETDLYRPSLPAASLAAWTSPAQRREFVPVTLSGSPDEGYRFRPLGTPGQPTVSDLAAANALAVVREGVGAVGLGDVVHCMVLDG